MYFFARSSICRLFKSDDLPLFRSILFLKEASKHSANKPFTSVWKAFGCVVSSSFDSVKFFFKEREYEMIWVLILTIVFLLVVVALETACLLLIARSEYVAISGVMRNGKKGTVKNRLVDSR